MTVVCSKENMLNEFRDNDVQAITAESMRLLVNCVYDNFLTLDAVIDNIETYTPNQALSANQGALLNDSIEENNVLIQELDFNKAEKIDVYTKSEIDNDIYKKDYIDSTVYKKDEVYNKHEIETLAQTFQDAISQINDRIDNIVNLNNLIE
jgi:hypothetical protein